MPVCKNRAWEKLEQLSFIRVAGTPEELKAAQFLKAECDAIGVEAVIEDFEIEMPEITKATFAVLEPEYKEEIVAESYSKLFEGVRQFVNQSNFERYIMILKSAGIIDDDLVRSQNVLNFGYILYLLLILRMV